MDFNNINFYNDINMFFSVVKLNDMIFKHMLDRCIKFSKRLALQSQSIEYYKSFRNGVKPWHDILIGKLGEVFAAEFINRNFPCSKLLLPDFSIYMSEYKSWKEDLVYETEHSCLPAFHVKACSSYTKRLLNNMDLSWTFQFSNNNGIYGKDYIYREKKNDIILFVYLENFNINKAEIVFSSPWAKIKDYLKPPKKEYLIGKKECIYLSDVINISNNVWWQ